MPIKDIPFFLSINLLFGISFGLNSLYKKLRYSEVHPYVAITQKFVRDDLLRTEVSGFEFNTFIIENRRELYCSILCGILTDCWITIPRETGCDIVGYGTLPGSSQFSTIESHEVVYMKKNG